MAKKGKPEPGPRSSKEEKAKRRPDDDDEDEEEIKSPKKKIKGLAPMTEWIIVGGCALLTLMVVVLTVVLR